MGWWVVLGGVLVAWYIVTSDMVVWRARGPPPPIEVGAIFLGSCLHLVLAFLASCLKKKKGKKAQIILSLDPVPYNIRTLNILYYDWDRET